MSAASATPSEVASASLALAPGVHVTTAFLPGLTVTLPPDWQVVEEGSEEFLISPTANLNTRVSLWLDPTLVDRKDNPVGVANTPAAFAGWLAKDPDLTVSRQKSAVVGSDFQATVLDLAVSAAAVNTDPGCPVDVCVAFIRLSRGTGFAMARGELERFYLVSVGGTKARLLVIGLDAFTPVDFAAITKGALPLLGSLTLPATIP